VVEQPPGWSDPPTYDPGLPATLTWYTPTLAAGVTGTIVYTVTVNPDVLGVITNTVCISTATPGALFGSNCDDERTVVTDEPDVTVSKAVGPDPAALRSRLVYTLVYANLGPVPAENVVVSDTLPAEVTYASANPTPDSGPPNPLLWNLGTLDPGVSGTITVAVTVRPGLTEPFTNTVCITTTTTESNYDNNCDFPPMADVTIAKADDVDPVAPGGQLVYTLVYTNNGAPAKNVVVSDTLPAEVTYASANPIPDSGPPNPLQWDLGTLDVGDTGTIVVTVTVGADVTQTFTNPVCISTATAEWNTDNNCDEEPTDVGLPADVTIRKSDDPDPVGPDGSHLVYTLVYTNNGPGVAEGVVVTDVLPDGAEFVLAVPSQASGPNPLTWNLGTLAAGQSGTIVVTVAVTSCVPRILTNRVRVSTATPESNYDNNDDEESTRVQAAVVTIDKQDEPDPGEPGKTVIYTLAYANEGPIDAQEVYITDTLPVSVTFGGVVDQPPGWSMLPGSSPPLTLTWYTPVLAAGVSGRIVYRVTADPEVPEEVESKACVRWWPHETDCQRCDTEPTPVRLLHFRARPMPGAVLLEWETAWEVDSYGFALLRGASGRLEDAQEIAFVPAAGRGGGRGAAYSYVDRDLESGSRYSYWLVEVDSGGRRTVYRPVTAAAFPDPLYRTYLPLIWRLW
jgi:uncharacterized repeat protein (TIGR01451 family)